LEKKADRIKITVLKCFDTREVFKEPPIKTKITAPCSVFKEGQVFHVDNFSMPSGFCSYAWYGISAPVYMLMCGGNAPPHEEGVSVICCPDGLRPVVFKLERER